MHPVMPSSFVMQIVIYFLTAGQPQGFVSFQGGGADLTGSYAFLQDFYLLQLLNELCQRSCWYDPLDIRAREVELLMMHALLVPVESNTEYHTM